MPHAKVRPARHVNYSTELMTNVRGVHGHEAYCGCGWTGMTWKRPGEAQAEARWHYLTEHQDVIAARKREDAQATRSAEAS